MYLASLTGIFEETKMWQAIVDTLYMVGFSTLFAYILGMPLGIVCVLTDKDGITPNRYINKIIGFIINIGRSIPFMVLAIVLVNFTRFIVGKSWGSTAALVPLSLAATFFVARIVEQSLKEVDKGVVESAICMGAPLKTMISKVYLKESLPTLIRGFAITAVNLIGYSAMAGALGAGGLGKVAISYGQGRYRLDILLVTVVILIILVQLIQIIFDIVAHKIDKRSR